MQRPIGVHEEKEVEEEEEEEASRHHAPTVTPRRGTGCSPMEARYHAD